MSRRMKAWLMFLILGLVLPMAGAPLRYCLCAHTVVMADESCCDCEDEAACDCHQDCPNPPAQPTCKVALKLLPDALPQFDVALPAPLAVDLPPVWFVHVPTPALAVSAVELPHDRGPPLGPPLYLRHRCLLL